MILTRTTEAFHFRPPLSSGEVKEGVPSIKARL